MELELAEDPILRLLDAAYQWANDIDRERQTEHSQVNPEVITAASAYIQSVASLVGAMISYDEHGLIHYPNRKQDALNIALQLLAAANSNVEPQSNRWWSEHLENIVLALRK